MKPGREGEYSDEQVADAAVVAVLRMLERRGVDREVLSEMTDSAQAAVWAAEARNRKH